MARFVSLLGMVTILGLAYAFSTNRRAIRYKTVAWGLGLQVMFAFLVLRWDYGYRAIKTAGDAVKQLLSYSYYGSSFVFGTLGAETPNPSVGRVFAFSVLPAIIFVSALFALLYHLGVMQAIIKVVARIMVKLMGVSGAESLDVAASIFMGQTEAPLTIRPFLPHATLSELMTIMTAGMAHISGSIMVAYIAFGAKPENLLAAVIMTAPGTILLAKMLVPETETPLTGDRVVMPETQREANFLGAIAKGTLDGGHLFFNVAIMLVSFIAMIYMLDGIMSAIHNLHLTAFGMDRYPFFWVPESIEKVLGFLFAPVAWLIGVPWKDCPAIGNLLGTRMVLNEFVAYSRLGGLKDTLDPRSFTIATFALCGFANLSSIGIQIGGIGALAPDRRSDLARLGFRAMLAGTMANLMSASIVGLFL